MVILILALFAAFLIVCGIGALAAVIFAVAWSIVLCIRVGGVLLILALLWDIYTMYRGGTVGYDKD